jgi:CDP-diacylglycerol--serine O-phosphatidyltransferase
MTEQRERRHFSMIRTFHLADLFTIANGACGITAVFHAMKYLRTENPIQIYGSLRCEPSCAVQRHCGVAFRIPKP